LLRDDNIVKVRDKDRLLFCIRSLIM